MKQKIYKILYKLLGWWRLKTKKNFGYIQDKIDNNLGEVINWEVLQKSGQWDLYLPEYEYQKYPWGDTMNCTEYSKYNLYETLLKRLYNWWFDFCDRFGGKMAGNTRQGNSMYNTFQTDLINGFISQGDKEPFYPNKGNSWDDYYAEIPDDIKKVAKANIGYFDFGMKWISPTSTENLREALKYSPLWVAIYAYGPLINGVYQRIVGNMPNHCVMIYGYDNDGNWKVYDHYLGGEHRLLAPDYIIGFAANLYIRKK